MFINTIVLPNVLGENFKVYLRLNNFLQIPLIRETRKF